MIVVVVGGGLFVVTLTRLKENMPGVSVASLTVVFGQNGLDVGVVLEL